MKTRARQGDEEDQQQEFLQGPGVDGFFWIDRGHRSIAKRGVRIVESMACCFHFNGKPLCALQAANQML